MINTTQKLPQTMKYLIYFKMLLQSNLSLSRMHQCRKKCIQVNSCYKVCLEEDKRRDNTLEYLILGHLMS